MASRKRSSTPTPTKQDADRELPNKNDPLSEPSRHRRIWAAYLQRGMNRAEWARKLGTQYTSADRWDKGESVMALDTFMRACELLGYTAEQLHYGKRASSRVAALPALTATNETAHEPELGDESIRVLLRELEAAPEERRALAQLRDGAGKFDALTESYVREFVGVAAQLRQRGVPESARTLQAHTAALRVQAQGRVIASPAK